MSLDIHMNTPVNLNQNLTYFQSSLECIQHFLINPEMKKGLQKSPHRPEIEIGFV